MHKNYLHKLNQIKNAYLSYLFHNEKNKERIKNVLKGSFKPLHGIKGSLHIYGHKHVHPFLDNKLAQPFIRITKSNKSDADISEIKTLMQDPDFSTALLFYQKDIQNIKDIIKSSHINKIGEEVTAKVAERTKLNIHDRWERFDGLLDQQAKDDLFLVLFGPVMFLYMKGELPGIEVFGAEGAALSKALAESNKIMEDIKQDPNIENHKKYTATAKSHALSRDIESSQNIQQHVGDSVLLVIGEYHTKSIKALMPKDRKVTTSSVSK